MENSLQSDGCTQETTAVKRPAGWVRSGAMAVVGALVGGLLAAWWYRSTLSQLRQAEADSKNPHFGIPSDPPADED